MAVTIHLAYSKNKHGFTVYSYEWDGHFKSGQHKHSEDTLKDAKDYILKWVRDDFTQLGLDVPPIFEHGKVSEVTGRTFSY